MTWVVKGSWVSAFMVFVVAGLFLVLVPVWLLQSREQARESGVRYGLRTLVLAAENYTDTHLHLPRAIQGGANEDYLHSELTMLIPYLEALPTWWQWLRFDKEWNDVENDIFAKDDFPAFLSPKVSCLATIEGYAASHFSINALEFRFDADNADALGIKDSSSKWWFVERKDEVSARASPCILRDDVVQLTTGQYSNNPDADKRLAAFADGSVRYAWFSPCSQSAWERWHDYGCSDREVCDSSAKIENGFRIGCIETPKDDYTQMALYDGSETIIVNITGTRSVKLRQFPPNIRSRDRTQAIYADGMATVEFLQGIKGFKQLRVLAVDSISPDAIDSLYGFRPHLRLLRIRSCPDDTRHELTKAMGEAVELRISED